MPEERIGDDEQRSAATPVRPARSGCGGSRPAPALLLLGVPWQSVRRRRLALAPLAGARNAAMCS